MIFTKPATTSNFLLFTSEFRHELLVFKSKAEVASKVCSEIGYMDSRDACKGLIISEMNADPLLFIGAE